MKRNVSVVVATLMAAAVGLAFSGCGDVVVGPQDGDIEATLTAETTEVEPGEEVGFTLAISNVTETTLALEFASEMKYDLVVSHEESPVWSWSFDHEFEFEETELVLGAQETLTYDLVWPGVDQDGDEVEPGSYEARAMVLPSNVEVEDAVLELTVTE